MGLARFHTTNLPARGMLWLEDAEAHHAARVLRVQPGDDVLIFDGRGNEGFGKIHEVSKRQVAVDIASVRFAPRDHDGLLTLAIAMPKGDRQRSVIEKLVELGVDCLVPIASERSVARLDSDAMGRLERYGMEACKQCQRNRLMRIEPCRSLGEWLKSSGGPEATLRWLVHPGAEGDSMASFVEQNDAPKSGHNPQGTRGLLFAIGPEGGFSAGEVEEAREAGFRILNLGERILRVETAVSVVATLGHLRLALSLAGSPSSR